MEERWHSVDEIGSHLGIARETVYRWIDRRGLPAHRIGKFCEFKVSEVDDRATFGGADPSVDGAHRGRSHEEG